MDINRSQLEARKPYQKPALERVRLVPEQAVLDVCKQDTGTLGSNGTVTGCGLGFNQCVQGQS